MKIRESWTKSLRGLGMYKPELDEAKEALSSEVAAMHEGKNTIDTLFANIAYIAFAQPYQR